MVLHSVDKRCEAIRRDQEMVNLCVFLVARVATIRAVVHNEETVKDSRHPGTHYPPPIQVCGQRDFKHAHEPCPHRDNRTVSLLLTMKVILHWDSSWMSRCPTAKLKTRVNSADLNTPVIGIITKITKPDRKGTTAWMTLTLGLVKEKLCCNQPSQR